MDALILLGAIGGAVLSIALIVSWFRVVKDVRLIRDKLYEKDNAVKDFLKANS